MKSLAEEYFDWLCSLVKYNSAKSYTKMLSVLHGTSFTYSMPLDENRYGDGINMRYRFAYENYIPTSGIEDKLAIGACTVLEMIIALCVRCEEHIMDDPDIGNRTWIWFWDMMDNLGLSKYDDNNFDIDEVERIIDIFLQRKYRRNGKGGLFRTGNPDIDMRRTEIWCQAMNFFNDVIEKGE